MLPPPLISIAVTLMELWEINARSESIRMKGKLPQKQHARSFIIRLGRFCQRIVTSFVGNEKLPAFDRNNYFLFLLPGTK
mmetsp:Transcript_31280/g.66566  ORF Transcript_31280/g.66566 Transcript_31280/m.66566 type:complete len:80 (+) Transcript_31280:1167-1406(+)